MHQSHSLGSWPRIKRDKDNKRRKMYQDVYFSDNRKFTKLKYRHMPSKIFIAIRLKMKETVMRVFWIRQLTFWRNFKGLRGGEISSQLPRCYTDMNDENFYWDGSGHDLLLYFHQPDADLHLLLTIHPSSQPNSSRSIQSINQSIQSITVMVQCSKAW